MCCFTPLYRSHQPRFIDRECVLNCLTGTIVACIRASLGGQQMAKLCDDDVTRNLTSPLPSSNFNRTRRTACYTTLEVYKDYMAVLNLDYTYDYYFSQHITQIYQHMIKIRNTFELHRHILTIGFILHPSLLFFYDHTTNNLCTVIYHVSR